MKLSFSTLGCPEWQWNDIYATARDLGYDGVVIRGIGREMFAPKMSIFSHENIEKTKNTISGAGLSIPLFTTAITFCFISRLRKRRKRRNCEELPMRSAWTGPC